MVKLEAAEGIGQIDDVIEKTGAIVDFYLRITGSAIGTRLQSTVFGGQGPGSLVAAGAGSKALRNLFNSIPESMKTDVMTEVMENPSLLATLLRKATTEEQKLNIASKLKKILGKAALKAKRQAAKDAVKRSQKQIRVKEGTILKESKFIDNSKEVLKKYKNKLNTIKELEKKKDPKQIQLSNIKKNLNEEYKELNRIVKGFGEGSKIGKSMSKAEKMLTKLEKQALGQEKQIQKKIKDSGVKVTSSKKINRDNFKRKTKKKERSPTKSELEQTSKIDKLRLKETDIGANAKIQARLLENLLKAGTKKDKFKNLRTDNVKPLVGKARQNVEKELAELQSQFGRKKGGLIKRKAGGPCKPRGVGAALRGFKMKGSK